MAKNTTTVRLSHRLNYKRNMVMEVANNILLGGMYAKELSQSGKGIKLIKKNGLANEFFFFQSDLTVYG